MGRIMIVTALVGGLALGTAPLWGDRLLRMLVGQNPYADTYYVVIRFDVVWVVLALWFAAGMALAIAGRRDG